MYNTLHILPHSPSSANIHMVDSPISNSYGDFWGPDYHHENLGGCYRGAWSLWLCVYSVNPTLEWSRRLVFLTAPKELLDDGHLLITLRSCVRST